MFGSLKPSGSFLARSRTVSRTVHVFFFPEREQPFTLRDINDGRVIGFHTEESFQRNYIRTGPIQDGRGEEIQHV